MGFFKGLFKVAAIGVGIAVLGPLILTVGNMDGIDGYCDDD
ncbi:MAG: hypothetical protein QF440_02285 [Candidatus Thalassarchaeaceae archaeon]|jgi:hypothetical protein|nr:hypothetical protein [Candidatus Thalassarchaeaceae archaeon]